MQIEPYHPAPSPAIPQPQALPLNYYATPAPEKDEISLKQILGIFVRRGWVITSVAVAVTGAIWAWTLTRPKIYQSGFQVLVEPVTNVNKQETVLFGPQSSFDYATQIEVLRSPNELKPIVEDLQKTYPDMTYDELVAKMTIAQVQDADNRPTKILFISYRDPDPKKIQNVLEALSRGYLRYSIELRQTSLQQGVQFIDDQLPDLRKRVEYKQRQMQRFRQTYSLIDPQVRAGELSSLISNVERQRQEAQTQLTEVRSLYSALQQQVGSGPRQAIVASSLSESPRYQGLLTQIQQLEAKIAVESARLQPTNPILQALVAQRQELLPLLNQESARITGSGRNTTQANGNLTSISLDLNRQLVNAANQVQTLQVRNQALVSSESRLKREFALVPALARQYTDLQRELLIATDSLNRFLSSRENLQLEAAQKAIPWQQLAAPRPAGAPISPNIPRNLGLGVVAGLLLGLGAALLAEKLDNVFHTPNDLKDSTRLPLLGIIPFRRELRELAPSSVGRLNANQDEGLLPAQPNGSFDSSEAIPDYQADMSYSSSPFLDAFRSLHTNIRFLSSDEPIRSLTIGSAVPADGKSTVAVHLAQAAAAMGQRVLLVDADLRRPQVHSVLDLPNVRGLSNVISTDLDPNELIQQLTRDENLFILTSGQIPPDPTKLLSSRKMQHLVAQFEENFDLVIYDTPPLLGLADSSLLSAHTDGIVLVVGLGRTDRSALMQALDGLKISSTTVLGIVANGVKADAAGNYYNAYYNRYYNQASQPVEEPAVEEPVA